jgi:hypothetical protein
MGHNRGGGVVEILSRVLDALRNGADSRLQPRHGQARTEISKCAQLVATVRARGYSAGGPQVIVSRAEFFDGNQDTSSIGCNLVPHPGIPAFAAALHMIESMEGVAGVYIGISEIVEHTDAIWPFSDTAWIVTLLKPTAFAPALLWLNPDETGIAEGSFANPPAVPDGYHLVRIWWD